MRAVALAVPALALIGGALAHEEHAAAKPLPAAGTAAYRKMAAGYRKSVEPVFKAKCFDCHSSATRYPWYHRVPGIKQLIDRDIRKGRRIMDFTKGFPFKGLGTAQERMNGLHEVITDGSMPPFMYRIAHPGSAITAEERATILAWINREG